MKNYQQWVAMRQSVIAATRGDTRQTSLAMVQSSFDVARHGAVKCSQNTGHGNGPRRRPRYSCLPQRLHVETSSPKAFDFVPQS
jgi:hypothetical protein